MMVRIQFRRCPCFKNSFCTGKPTMGGAIIRCLLVFVLLAIASEAEASRSRSRSRSRSGSGKSNRKTCEADCVIQLDDRTANMEATLTAHSQMLALMNQSLTDAIAQLLLIDWHGRSCASDDECPAVGRCDSAQGQCVCSVDFPFFIQSTQTCLDECDFEEDLCSFTQATDDQIDWRRNSGGTPSKHTGPSVDHTRGQDAGHYVYIETSDIPVGSIARLVSPQVTADQPKCLTFWYHMLGYSIGTLNVYTMVDTDLGTAAQLVWTRSGEIDDNWYQANISIPAMGTYNIVFEGVRGGSWEGDIAIDDIGLVTGDCN